MSFPGSVLIRIMISASDSAATAFKNVWSVLVTSSAAVSRWPPFCWRLLLENRIDLVFSQMNRIILKLCFGPWSVFVFHPSTAFFLAFIPSIAALSSYLFSFISLSHCKPSDVTHGASGHNCLLSLPISFRIIPAVLYTSVFPLLSSPHFFHSCTSILFQPRDYCFPNTSKSHAEP